jgi:hypothetical protein
MPVLTTITSTASLANIEPFLKYLSHVRVAELGTHRNVGRRS